MGRLQQVAANKVADAAAKAKAGKPLQGSIAKDKKPRKFKASTTQLRNFKAATKKAQQKVLHEVPAAAMERAIRDELADALEARDDWSGKTFLLSGNARRYLQFAAEEELYRHFAAGNMVTLSRDMVTLMPEHFTLASRLLKLGRGVHPDALKQMEKFDAAREAATTA
jgi:UDP-N-acetylmuramate-alanine ligase